MGYSRFERPRQWLKTHFEQTLDRFSPPYNKEQVKPLIPIVGWDLDPKLQAILNDPNQKLAVGSVVAAGHMPNGFSDAMLADPAVKLTRNHVGHVDRYQIKRLHELKSAIKKDGPFRFIDSFQNISKQERKLFKKLERIYNKQKREGATKVLFSVCAISAGFDLNYANALLKLMEKVGHENIVFSVFLPFSKSEVMRYSVSGQGLNPQYWVDQWKNLQKVAEQHPNNIFIHEPKLLPAPEGKIVSEASVNDVDSIHKRGQEINNNPDSVYSDVNRQLVAQAMRAVRWNAKKVRGIFAEAFQTSNALLGGGPEIMAMLLQAGVPVSNLDIVQKGLTERKLFGRARMLYRYVKEYRLLMKDWDADVQITQAWGKDNAPLRRSR